LKIISKNSEPEREEGKYLTENLNQMTKLTFLGLGKVEFAQRTILYKQVSLKVKLTKGLS